MGTRCKAVIVDLDGTYVVGNSLKMYFKWLCGKSLRRVKLGTFLTLVVCIGARKLRLISHASMKSAVLRRCGWLTTIDMLQFCAKLLKKVNADVVQQIAEYQSNGCRIVMATAAPDIYAPTFASLCGFDACLSTAAPIKGKPYVECRGEEKLRRVKDWLKANDADMVAFFTDHEDDRPLADFNTGKTYWVR